jgi:selenide, water dikinase
LKTRKDPRALVGFATSDDAAVYRLNAREAVVSTVDFFPPVVDDPFAFGEIAAANALSDIWAMGARPLFALNLVAFPTQALPVETLGRILEGGQSKADEAGVPILGGHSVDDPEPKYGMAVTGLVHPRRILTNSGGRAGDVLLLTKPLGSGIATTAIKRGIASPELERSVVELMSGLNRAAGEVFASGKFPVHALTDVTGFGLLGHLTEMALGAKLRARLFLERVPILAGVPALAEQGVVPGGTTANLEHFEQHARFPDGLPLPIRHVLADAQTNGGLLAAVPRNALRRAERALDRARVDAAIIGELVRGRPGIDVA